MNKSDKFTETNDLNQNDLNDLNDSIHNTNNRPLSKNEEISPIKRKFCFVFHCNWINRLEKKISQCIYNIGAFLITNIVTPFESLLDKTDWLNEKKIIFWEIISPRIFIYKLITFFWVIFIIIIFYITLWIYIGDDWISYIKYSPYFSIFILVLFAYILGTTLHSIINILPALIGMLVAGIILNNASHLTEDIVNNLSPKLIAYLRCFAVGITLFRAGIVFNFRNFITHFRSVLLLGILPSFVESIAIGIPSHFLLKLPWVWSFSLGWICAPISPAIINLSFTNLKNRRYELRNNLFLTLLASACLDDVISIGMFSTIISIDFPIGKSIYWTIFHGPIEIIFGIFGLIFGLLFSTLRILPKQYNPLRIVALIIICFSSIYGFGSIGYSGTGAFIVVALGVLIARTWTIDQLEYISDCLNSLWIFIQPLLFVLLGCLFEAKYLNGEYIGYALIVIFIGIIIRIMTAMLISCCCSGYSFGEVLFTGLAFIPKATVQAAIAGIPIYKVLKLESLDQDKLVWAHIVLNTAVLMVLISAPLGAILIPCFGPFLLSKKINKRVIDTNIHEIESPKQDIKLENELQEDNKCNMDERCQDLNIDISNDRMNNSNHNEVLIQENNLKDQVNAQSFFETITEQTPIEKYHSQ